MCVCLCACNFVIIASWWILSLLQEYEKTWCVARPSSSEAELKSNIEYACNNLRDCKMREEGGSCYEPYSLMSHASIVMNQYYVSAGRNYWNCDFRGSALLVVTDPSKFVGNVCVCVCVCVKRNFWGC